MGSTPPQQAATCSCDDDDDDDDDDDATTMRLHPSLATAGRMGCRGGYPPSPRWWAAASGKVAAGFGVMSAMTMMTAKHTLLLGGLHAPAAGCDVFLWNASLPQRT